MIIKRISIGLLTVVLLSLNTVDKELTIQETYPDVIVVGAMKNVMWKGELQGIINLDTISNKKGLYGLGPESYLMGELLINDGKSYVSRVLTDTTMDIEKTFSVEAPFFVYGNVNEWNVIELPNNVTNIKDLESFIDKKTKDYKRPFVFKLICRVATSDIHIQNLPKGKKVDSPEEAHQGQTNYTLRNEQVEIIGFFSTDHKGVFTHHDSYLHMHLITKDGKQMGHLDKAEFSTGNMKLYLPLK